jgi:hypothetical protein
VLVCCRHCLTWFTVYSTFSSVQHHPGLDVRIMLPNTVYLYQKHPLNKEEINIPPATWHAAAKTIVCDVGNHVNSLVRVEEVRISGPHASESSAGFLLLPLGRRHLELILSQSNPDGLEPQDPILTDANRHPGK